MRSVTPEEPQEVFPAHHINPPNNPGNACQVYIFTERMTYTREGISQLAIRMCEKYSQYGAFHVMFFDEESRIYRSSSELEDSDWPHWLCDAAVFTNESGNLYVQRLVVANDLQTGQPKTNVFRPN